MNDDHRERRNEPVPDGSTWTGVGSGLRPTRRGVLRGTAAATIAAGFGSLAVGQEDGETIDPGTTIELGGLTEGWQGRAPEAIADQENPTLALQPGETYTVTWENADGLPHNFVILDAEESVIERTEIISNQGQTQTLEFEATEAMATYLCEVHPTSMRGSIQIGDAAEEEEPQAQLAPVPPGPEVGLQLVAGGDPLNQPVTFASTTVEGTERRFIADQTGEIYFMADDGSLEPFLDITERLIIRNEGFDERGLLGLAFHPDFENNRRFYVRYSSFPRDRDLPEEFDHMFLLSEFQANEAFTEADPDSERVLLEIPEPQFNHNAGDIAFGPDGYLYVTVGDGGGADDTGIGHVADWYEENRGGNGQDLTENLLGSILRIDVDDREGDLPYGIPDDNPLVDREGLDEQWAWGFRNPWRFSFNDGQLVVADVGQNLWEEIDVVEQGGNYGWNVREGAHCFSAENPADPEAITECPTSAPEEEPYDGQPLIDPVLEYPHTIDGAVVGISVTGGYVYQGTALSELAGQYVFGDWGASFEGPAGRLFVADIPELETTTEPDGVEDGNVTEDGMADGNLTEDGNVTEVEPIEEDENATEDGNISVDNVSVEPADGNVTDGDNETDPFNETEAFNETGGNETMDEVAEGNVTVGNETADGNATANTDGDAAANGAGADLPMRELTVANTPDGRLNRSVLAFGRDAEGEMYVLTSDTTTIDGSGQVYRFVPPEEGDEIQPVEAPDDEQD